MNEEDGVFFVFELGWDGIVRIHEDVGGVWFLVGRWTTRCGEGVVDVP